MSRIRSCRRPHPTRGTVALALASLFLLITTASSAAATPRADRYQVENVANAAASGCATDPDGTETCTYLSVFVSERADLTDVCVLLFTEVHAPSGSGTAHEETGCTTVPDGGFTFDERRMATARLDTISMTLSGERCSGPENCTVTSRDITLWVNWLGVGPTTRTTHQQPPTDDACAQSLVTHTATRAANAVIALDDGVLRADSAEMVSYRRVAVGCAGVP